MDIAFSVTLIRSEKAMILSVQKGDIMADYKVTLKSYNRYKNFSGITSEFKGFVRMKVRHSLLLSCSSLQV